MCVAIVTPHAKCRLRLLKLERIKDYLLMEEEFIRNQERLKPQDEKNEVGSFAFYSEMPVPGEMIYSCVMTHLKETHPSPLRF